MRPAVARSRNRGVKAPEPVAGTAKWTLDDRWDQQMLCAHCRLRRQIRFCRLCQGEGAWQNHQNKLFRRNRQCAHNSGAGRWFP